MRISESKLNAIIRESLNDVLYEIHALKAVKNINADTRKRIDNGENQYAAHYTHNGQSFDMNKLYADKLKKGKNMEIQTIMDIVRKYPMKFDFWCKDDLGGDSPVSFYLSDICFPQTSKIELKGTLIYNYSIKWIGKIDVKNDIGFCKCSFHILNKGKAVPLDISKTSYEDFTALINELKNNQ